MAPRLDSTETIRSGALAGTIGALAMGTILVAGSAVQGGGLFTPFKMIATTILGPSAMSMGGGRAVLLGVLMHLTMSVVFGVAFARFLPRGMSGAAAAALGGVVGLLLFLAMTYLVLPWANPLVYRHADRGLLILGHLFYGVCLGFAVPLRYVFRRRPARATSTDSTAPPG